MYKRQYLYYPTLVSNNEIMLSRQTYGKTIYVTPRVISHYLVGGIVTLDDASFTTSITVHGGVNALAPFGCMALRDTGNLQTFSRRDVLDSACSRWGQYMSRTNGNALLDPGVAFAYLPICKR